MISNTNVSGRQTSWPTNCQIYWPTQGQYLSHPSTRGSRPTNEQQESVDNNQRTGISLFALTRQYEVSQRGYYLNKVHQVNEKETANIDYSPEGYVYLEEMNGIDILPPLPWLV